VVQKEEEEEESFVEYLLLSVCVCRERRETARERDGRGKEG
jgi:hypothetical protein